MPVFLRRIYNRYHKLGKKRGRKWRKPKGRDNKMREKRRGYPVVVSIGYRKTKGKKETIIVRNMGDLSTVKKGDIVMLGKIGKRKKIEIIKKASEMKISISNVNIKRFLRNVLKTETKNKNKEKK